MLELGKTCSSLAAGVKDRSQKELLAECVELSYDNINNIKDNPELE